MIKITSVEIDGFITPSQKVKLDFVESNVICIYGNNGSGKTTFLEILFAVFDRDEEVLRKHNIQNIKIEYIFDNIEIKKQIDELKNDLENISNKDEIDRINDDIIKLEKEINIIEKVNIYSDIDDENQLIYYFDDEEDKTNIYNLNNSKLGNLSALFLGIGRGIHKKELYIPRNKLWYFFNMNRKLSDGKKLSAVEIDKFTDKLVNYLMPKRNREVQEDNFEIEEKNKKRNLYLPNIEIDSIEKLLIDKYHKSIVEADKKINQALSKASMTLFSGKLPKYDNFDIDILEDKLLENRDLILKVFDINESYDDKFKKRVIDILNNFKNSKEYIEGIDRFNRLILNNIFSELKDEAKLYNQIQVFLNEYNKFLNCDKKLVLSVNGVYITPENHSIDKLSSGERHLLTFLATILLLGEMKDIILLDEPEISLDIEWQEKLLSTISKLAPDSQIIVASHSPSIMGDYFDESVEITLCE